MLTKILAERTRKYKPLSLADLHEWYWLSKDSDDKIVELVNDLREYRQWVDDLQSSSSINCVYCGHRYPPGSGEVMSEVLYEHIRKCPKHPLSKAEAKIAELLLAANSLLGLIDSLGGRWSLDDVGPDRKQLAELVDYPQGLEPVDEREID